MPLGTPIAFFIFNRPDLTRKVFDRIRIMQPTTLLVVADAARPTVSGEAKLCENARGIITDVDWPCNVLTNIAAENMGCRHRMSSGLSWVFNCVESAIILEDDCVPDVSFFEFCAELLVRYREDQRVMMIAGHINQFGRHRSEASYYFSRMPMIWGWATWRRAWAHYDIDMKLWPSVEGEGWLLDIFGNAESERYWRDILTRTYRREIDTWDYQWMFACWLQNGLCVSPTTNLVTNLGFRADATHTIGFSRFASLETAPLVFPLRHPSHFVCDEALTSLAFTTFHKAPALWARIAHRVRKKWLRVS